MGVLHRLADGQEKLQPLARTHVILIAEVGDAHALDQLHHEVRPAGSRRASIKNFGDVGVVHDRQRLPFRLETRDDLARVHAGLDDLQSDLAAHRLGPFGYEDDAEAALADLLEQFVVTDDRAGTLVDRLANGRLAFSWLADGPGTCVRRGFEEAASPK